MKIIVIGGGASGLTAAICAAGQGAKETVLEAADRPAKKIYATGNGKCNLTNQKMDELCYRGMDPEFAKRTLEKFGFEETLEFFGNMGMMFKNRNGYFYPSSGQASSVAELLIHRCEEAGVSIRVNCMVKEVTKKNGTFLIRCKVQKKQGKKVLEEKEITEKCDKVILAAGSNAGGFGCEITGSRIAAQMGHCIVPEVPALTALECGQKDFFQKNSGVRTDGKITVLDEGEHILAEDTGELQLTAYGVSGIPAFQVSRYAAYALRQKKPVYAQLDFLSEFSFVELYDKIQIVRKRYPESKISDVLSCIFNRKLAESFLDELKVEPNFPVSKMDPARIKKLLQHMKKFRVKILNVKGMEHAQVCAGGVSTGELTDEFMSRKVKDLYIIGETVDIDGMCGGYNLQFAWAGGWISGHAAAETAGGIRCSVSE